MGLERSLCSCLMLAPLHSRAWQVGGDFSIITAQEPPPSNPAGEQVQIENSDPEDEAEDAGTAVVTCTIPTIDDFLTKPFTVPTVAPVGDGTVIDVYHTAGVSGMVVDIGGTLLIDCGQSDTQSIKLGAWGPFTIGTSAAAVGGVRVLMNPTDAVSELAINATVGSFKVTGPTSLEMSATGDNIADFQGTFVFAGKFCVLSCVCCSLLLYE